MEIKAHNKEQLLLAFKRFRSLDALTQEELSEKSSVPQSSISKFEKGTREPSLSVLFKLAAALGLEVVIRKKKKVKSSDKGIVI